MKKDSKQSGFCFSDLDGLFTNEAAAFFNPSTAPVTETEPCEPGGCEHSNDEHRAFDTGVEAGERDVDAFDNPYTDSNLIEAWLSGHSIGEMNRGDSVPPDNCGNVAQ